MSDALSRTAHDVGALFDAPALAAALPAAEPILLAVSGGADSVALLHVLGPWLVAHGHVVYVAHVHHGMRGSDADADADFVKQLAAQGGYVFHRRDVRVAQPTEQALAEARHGALREVARAVNARIVMLAHTEDDLAETFLMHLARGAGSGGARFSWWQTDAGGLTIVRPFGATPRSALRAWSQHQGQTWREDATNFGDAATRNRVRHEVLPILNERVHAGATRALARSAEIVGEEARLVAALAALRLRAWQRDHRQRGLGAMSPVVRSSQLADCSPALARAALQRFVQRACWPGALFRDSAPRRSQLRLRCDQIEAMRTLASSRGEVVREVTLSNTVSARRVGPWLLLHHRDALVAKTPLETSELSVGDTEALAAWWTKERGEAHVPFIEVPTPLELHRDNESGVWSSVGDGLAFSVVWESQDDRASNPCEWVVRNKRPGDRSPSGTPLKDLLVKTGVPAPLRGRVVVLARGSHVAAVLGLRGVNAALWRRFGAAPVRLELASRAPLSGQHIT